MAAEDAAPDAGERRDESAVRGTAPTVRAEQYLAPETLLQLAPFEIRAKMIVEGVMSGLHRSPYQGMAVEFAEYRQYVPGDDLRHLDWKVWGRSDKLYVKRYQQETNLDVVLMVDASSSMRYGSLEVKAGWGGTVPGGEIRRWTKFDHAVALAVAVSYVCLERQDRVGMVVFDDAIRSILARSASRAQWRSIVEMLRTHAVDRPTDFARTVEETLGKIANRALFVVLSDLFEDPEAIRTALARFRHRGHDVILMQILDRRELRFDLDEIAPLEGLEGEGRLRIDPRALRDGYLEALQAHVDEIGRLAMSFGFDHHVVDSHASVGPPLAHLLARRAALAKRSGRG